MVPRRGCAERGRQILSPLALSSAGSVVRSGDRPESYLVLERLSGYKAVLSGGSSCVPRNGTATTTASQRAAGAIARPEQSLTPESQSSLSVEERDLALGLYLDSVQRHPPESWVTGGGSHREHAPAYFQYPAMMSPVVQRDLLAAVLSVAPESRSIFDPFCGSGTILSEAMYAGLSCWASDINPLAVLLCRVKSGMYRADVLSSHRRDVLRRARSDSSANIETGLANWKKWFRRAAARELSTLRRAIRSITDADSRRFFWACLAETVRVTSNSRTSTYKLHIREKKEIRKAPLPLKAFKAISKQNINHHKTVGQYLHQLGYLQRERYTSRLDVQRQDVTSGFKKTFSILMTSPPYGDNTTTVPYGQHSYLPLQWIDLTDIDDRAPQTLLRTTQQIDRLSLGGKLPRRREIEALKYLTDVSPTLLRVAKRLTPAPPDRRSRVLGFVRDLDTALSKVVPAVQVNGYMVWTIGNRRVGGYELPLADILRELLAARSTVFVGRCKRKIPQKRMAIRNSISPTMRTEHLLVFRRIAVKAVE